MAGPRDDKISPATYLMGVECVLRFPDPSIYITLRSDLAQSGENFHAETATRRRYHFRPRTGSRFGRHTYDGAAC
jgi:hypothetical protein